MADVSVVGLGRMGRAMAVRLVEHSLRVAVHNRTRQRAEDLAAEIGVDVCASAREAAAAADLVVVSVADDHALRELASGDDGLLAGLTGRSVVVETSTVSPDTMRWLADQAAPTGAAVLDAPVSGSVPSIQRGELVFLVGGPHDALERIRPVTDVLAKQVVHLGDVGTGAATKLAVNAVVHALNVSLSEALVLTERAGVPRAAAYDAIAASAAGAPFVHYKRSAFLDPEATPPAFALELVAKDLRLALELAAESGPALPQALANLDVVERAVEQGHGARDMSWLAEVHRRA
ncbi:MAG TPA: NAD(P)-dependent oxidoreductase [Egicoccus sp.]|nr:NAD(P)-dependent oxidoreductase [Egicoccus sp.]HSK23033.1 NAD(P)-dependent oxidoreductase [Egicoccus sp.]